MVAVVALVACLVLAVALVVVLARAGRARRAAADAAQRATAELTASQARAEAAEGEAAACKRDLEAAAQAAEEGEAQRLGLVEQLDEARARLAAAEAVAAAGAADADRLRGELAEAQWAAAAAGAGRDGGDELAWRLLLRRLERQWALVVGAHPGERGVTAAGRAEQLAEALRREVERLREEAGVHAEVAGDGPPAPPGAGRGPGPAELLAAGEVLAVLAAGADRVRVELGERVAVRAEGWQGEAVELEGLRSLLDGGLVEVADGDADGEVVVTLPVTVR